jgi:predicted small secreted protein
MGGVAWIFQERRVIAWVLDPKERTMRKRLTIMSLTLLALVGSAALLGACNTTAGVGADMAAAGKAIEDTADETKGY